jgi:hypothetical protein
MRTAEPTCSYKTRVSALPEPLLKHYIGVYEYGPGSKPRLANRSRDKRENSMET